MSVLGRWVIAILCAGLIALAASGGAAPLGPPGPPGLVPHEVTLPMDDGVNLAGTLYVPNSSPPDGGWAAIVFFHGLGGKRQDLDRIVHSVASNLGYVALAFDARGHGQSGGLVSVDGPREIADARAVYNWIAAQPNVSPQRIGAWGLSLGGGAVMRSLVEGVPWKAVEVLQTWTDLYSALAPQNLSKSGAIYSLLSSVPDSKRDPTLKAIEQDALASRNQSALRAWAAQRSSRSLLSKIKTPIYFFQGRRDFVFDIAQATAGYRLVKGPKRLYIGQFGHAPSTFPAPDIQFVTTEGHYWFERYLNGISFKRMANEHAPVTVAATPHHGKPRSSKSLPKTKRLSFGLAGRDTLSSSGKAVRTTARLRTKLETFGSARVRVKVTLSGGWSKLVAVLTAKPRRGREIVVSEGGINTSDMNGTRTLTIRMIDDATVIPKGSALTLTLASNSLAQDPGNLLYLQFPMPPAARISIGPAQLVLPVLRKQISR
jgi:predicted acyl esterase